MSDEEVEKMNDEKEENGEEINASQEVDDSEKVDKQDEVGDNRKKKDKKKMKNHQENKYTGPTVTFMYHHDELHLKGRNKSGFVKALIKNTKELLSKAGIPKEHISDNYTFQSGVHYITIPEDKEEILRKVSPKIFGVANFSKLYVSEKDEDGFIEEIIDHFRELNKETPIESFRVVTKRPYKEYPRTSDEFSRVVGQHIHERLGLKAELKRAKFSLYIKIQKGKFEYSFEKIQGALGLPVGTAGRVACLLSGGFDSPVACWQMMRRGADIQFIHFHSAPYGEWRSSVSKIREIVKVLYTWGSPPVFFSVPIGDSQQKIITDASEKYRVTLYRRLMLRVAKKIAESQRCMALCTGDALGQVASQTIESMTTIQQSLIENDNSMLILRPLVGFCKNEIITKANEIGTGEISEKPAGDCCAHMIPKNVATRPRVEDLLREEEKLDMPAMVEKALSEMQCINVNDPWNEEEGTSLGCPLAPKE